MNALDEKRAIKIHRLFKRAGLWKILKLIGGTYLVNSYSTATRPRLARCIVMHVKLSIELKVKDLDFAIKHARHFEDFARMIQGKCRLKEHKGE